MHLYFNSFFSGFFPVVINFLRRVPIIGNILNFPGISQVCRTQCWIRFKMSACVMCQACRYFPWLFFYHISRHQEQQWKYVQWDILTNCVGNVVKHTISCLILSCMCAQSKLKLVRRQWRILNSVYKMHIWGVVNRNK